MNTTRIATSLLLLIGGLTGCTSRSVADGNSPLLTTAQQPQLKLSKPQLVVQTGHANSVNGLAFSRDGKTILSGGVDGTMKLWRANRDEPLATLIALDKDDWVVVTSEGLFDASQGAEELMHYVVNTPERGYEVTPLEQLKSRYYEPGLLQKLLQGRTLEKGGGL